MIDTILWNTPYISTMIRVPFFIARGLLGLLLFPFRVLYELGR